MPPQISLACYLGLPASFSGVDGAWNAPLVLCFSVNSITWLHHYRFHCSSSRGAPRDGVAGCCSQPLALSQQRRSLQQPLTLDERSDSIYREAGKREKRSSKPHEPRSTYQKYLHWAIFGQSAWRIGMATLIPAIGSCASRMTSGERRFAYRLEEKLEDDYLCWYDVSWSASSARSIGS